jgi:hypothetical protein
MFYKWKVSFFWQIGGRVSQFMGGSTPHLLFGSLPDIAQDEVKSYWDRSVSQGEDDMEESIDKDFSAVYHNGSSVQA